MQTRKDCPQFKGWVAIGWDEPFKKGDKLCYIGQKLSDNGGRYSNPNEGYDLYDGGYDNGSQSCYWSLQAMAGLACYRKQTNPDDPYVSRSPSIPLNYNYSTALPLP